MAPTILGDLKIYTIKELSHTLQVSPRTLYEYIKQGKIDAKRLGKKYHITQEALEKYFKEPTALR